MKYLMFFLLLALSLQNCSSQPEGFGEGTLISTPMGNIPIEALKEGQEIYSLNAQFQKITVPILKIEKTALLMPTEMLKITFDDSIQLMISKDYPLDYINQTNQVQIFSEGSFYQGKRVSSVETIHYSGKYIYNILPQSNTGNIFLNDVQLGSPLFPAYLNESGSLKCLYSHFFSISGGMCCRTENTITLQLQASEKGGNKRLIRLNESLNFENEYVIVPYEMVIIQVYSVVTGEYQDENAVEELKIFIKSQSDESKTYQISKTIPLGNNYYGWSFPLTLTYEDENGIQKLIILQPDESRMEFAP